MALVLSGLWGLVWLSFNYFAFPGSSLFLRCSEFPNPRLHLVCTALRGDKFSQLPQGRSMDVWESLIYSIREARAHQSINSAAKCSSVAALSAHNSQQSDAPTLTDTAFVLAQHLLAILFWEKLPEGAEATPWENGLSQIWRAFSVQAVTWILNSRLLAMASSWLFCTNEHCRQNTVIWCGGNRNYEFCVYELYFCIMYLLHLFTLYLWAVIHIGTVYSEFRIWILQA